MEYDRLKNVGKLIAPAFYHISIAHFISSYWTSVLAPIITVRTTLSANHLRIFELAEKTPTSVIRLRVWGIAIGGVEFFDQTIDEKYANP
ncbi:hypothetical protein QTP88_023643 [Uroleucon formosanum]